MDNNINRVLLGLVIGLSALLLVGVGLGIGYAVFAPEKVSVEVDEQPAVEEEEVAKEQPQEKTYGYYPSFYVKRISYTVSAEEGSHSITVYTDGATKFVDANTDSRWLEEEKLGKGGKEFRVKKNRDDQSRKGKLFLYDNKGRKITITVTQKGKDD